MIKLKKWFAALVGGAMLLGMTAGMAFAPAVSSRAEDAGEIARIEIGSSYTYFLPGWSAEIWLIAYDSNGKQLENGQTWWDEFTWSLEMDGKEVENKPYNSDPSTIYINKYILQIGREVKNGTKITVKATSKKKPGISGSYTAYVETDPKTVASIALDIYSSDSDMDPGVRGNEFTVAAKVYTADGTWIYDWEPEEGDLTYTINGVPEWKEGMAEPGDGELPEESFFRTDGLYSIVFVGTKEQIEKEITATVTYKNKFSDSGTVTVWARRATEVFMEDFPSVGVSTGEYIEIYAYTSDQYSELPNDVIYSVTGALPWTGEIEDWDSLGENDTKESYYMQDMEADPFYLSLYLYVGTGEKNGKQITVTAASQSNRFLSYSSTATVCNPEIADSIELNCDDTNPYIIPGYNIPISAQVYNLMHDEIDDKIVWSVTGATNLASEKRLTEEETYFGNNESSSGEGVILHIGSKEPSGTKITITATSKTSGDVSASFTITVLKGILLDVDYRGGSAFLCSNGGDYFLFLEVCKKEGDPKGNGTVYCYEGNNISLDLSFLKLSKKVHVYVYGDQNTTAVPYTIAASPKKASVKFKYDPAKTFTQCFTLKEAEIADLEYRHQNESGWRPLADLENELDHLMVAGANLLVRQCGKDGTVANMPGTEIKLKIPVAPKAPKVKLNYAKNTVTLPKNSQVRVLGWYIYSEPDKNGNFDKVPYYYSAGENKDNLNLSPAALAQKLVAEYVEAYNKSIQAIKNGRKLDDQDQEYLLNDLKDGCSLLIRTSDNKKGNSQPVFVELKSAPVMETVIGSTIKAAVVTKEENGKKIYGDFVTVTYEKDSKEKESVKLTASGDNLFAYSTDGKKFTKIKSSGTTVKFEKIGSELLIRMEGMEDKKDTSKSCWASNQVTLTKDQIRQAK